MSANRPLFLLLFFISGACGLIYEIVWSRLLGFVFGGTTFAITTVLACFMGGLAAGSWLCGRLTHRVRAPARVYGILEIGIGLYCLAVPLLLDLALPLYRVLASVSGGSFFWLSLARVLVCLAVLLVPTALMGATLPLLSQAFARRPAEVGSAVAHLYGINTAGAFLGCAAAGFFLLPALGLSRTIWLAATLNASAGVAALIAAKSRPPDASPEVQQKRGARAISSTAKPTALAQPWLGPRMLLALYGLSGFAAMAYQVAWTRALVLALGASTYAFSAIVACFILGIALGSLLAARWISRLRAPLAVAGVLEGVIALSALLVVPLFGEMPALVQRLTTSAGASFERVLAFETLAVLALLIVPTLCMGALLPLVCSLYQAWRAGGEGGAMSAGSSVGDVYASNTAGTILGAAVTGFVLIPLSSVGMQRTILLASTLSGLIGTALLLGDRAWPVRRARTVAVVLWAAGLALALLVQPWSRAVMISGPYLGRGFIDPGSILFYREGVDTTVAVTSRRQGALSLKINGKTDASNEPDDMPTQVLSAHIPLMLRPHAKDVCIIGLGSGITAGAALAHPVDRVDMVEISPAVVEAATWFDPYNGGALRDPRLSLQRADGRNFLLLTDRSFDLIVSEPSNPWISGIANLYTREFFEIARARLKRGGLHCQWVHGYSIRADDFASVLATMAAVFPAVQLWETALGDYLIVGSLEPVPLDVEGMYVASLRPGVRGTLDTVRIHDPMQFGHHFIADGSQLSGWTAGRPILTDDRPHLEFSAPRYLIRNESERIAEALLRTGGTPSLKGGPGAPLARTFMAKVEAGRRARHARLAALQAMRRADWGAFESFREVAEQAPDDARMCVFLDDSITMLFRAAGTVSRARIASLHRDLASTAPCLVQLAQARAGGAARFSWPLGEQTGRPQAEADAALEEARRLLDVGAAEPAIPDLLRLWSLSIRQPETEFLLARAYALRGDRVRALDFLEQAVRDGFSDRARLESSEAYDALRGNPRMARLLAGL